MGAIQQILACLGGAAPTVPEVKNVGTVVTNAGTAVSWPTHAIGDFALLIVEMSGDATMLTPDGWTAVASRRYDSTANSTHLYVWSRFAETTSEPNTPVTIMGGDGHMVAQIITFADVAASVKSTAAYANFYTSGSYYINYPELTGITVPSLMLFVGAWALDSSSPSIYAPSSTQLLTGPTEITNVGTASGNGGGFVVYAGRTASTSISARTSYAPNVMYQSSMTIALSSE